MARRYRRKSHSSQIINDSIYASSRLPWWGALTLGLATFTFFYFIAPAWVMSSIDEQLSRPITEGLKMVLIRRVHWLEYLGIVSGIVGLFFTFRNYFISAYARSGERSVVNILSRIIGRSID
ncbi:MULTISPECIES: hypothetical protein [Colwelliaceae]|uniref:Drug/metabolite transporter (DMT)-like permease n=1 Tax=Thalassotalea piscium TaxID=1230533 RepID=A0A7X0NEH9_9GAMM|nr:MULTISPECIES: hypothetical protein [Colwelliaceae]MBB6541975.1 drug/metabolite transporter (DMT)-like permease [Thalassotalea piscium]